MADVHDLPLAEETDRYLGDLVRRYEAEREATLDLDWQQLGSLLEQPWSSEVVVNTLLGLIGEASLTLRLPDEAAVELAVQAGLPFALANRPGPVQVEESDWGPELRAQAWRRNWTPATRAAWVALLGESPDELLRPRVSGNGNGTGNGRHNGNGHGHASAVENLFGDGRAIFVNPHRSGRSGSSESLFPLIGCWLSAAAELSRDDDWRIKLLTGLDTIFDELIQNVRGHATRREGDPVFSLVKVQLDEEVVRIAVQDTGPGILETLKPKLGREGSENDGDVLAKLFTGELVPVGRARGIGLPRVWRTCLELRAELTVATGRGRLRSAQLADQPASWLGDFEAPGVSIALAVPLLPAA